MVENKVKCTNPEPSRETLDRVIRLLEERRPKYTPDTLLKEVEVAALLGVSAVTIRRWMGLGKLQGFRGAGSYRRVRVRDVAALMQAQGGWGYMEATLSVTITPAGREALKHHDQTQVPTGESEGLRGGASLPCAVGHHEEAAQDGEGAQLHQAPRALG